MIQFLVVWQGGGDRFSLAKYTAIALGSGKQFAKVAG
jgi:hypothetical protein